MSEWTLSDTAFHIERGNLADRTGGVVALGVTRDWSPGGPASGAVLSNGGERVRDEINSLEPASPGSIETIPPGELPADRIALVSMVPETQLEEPDRWIRDTYETLLEAVRNEGDAELSLPPLGLGDFDWSIDRTSRGGIESVREFTGAESSLDRINLVVYDAIEYSSVENFADEILGHQSSDPDAEQRLRDYY